ncbi:acyl carrier protein [Rouxiella badensis]|jgi:acyl carrier protein|uniref:Carrier domain-containing protein n=1 Tax=Rouxiella badensis TaxID=1646377 RepID=A0A1X0WH62_9GAMM|nr:phosphopantetheine-binding protein [Rouxiella badensis]MCC3704999.1 phosphopantetheine-binding protein [Rouxiella badensis]MCC3721457.1 phosphopantetheine-binding protein [Rouxiella badensis]MCC3731022.1 phosphopantetheine-binding protein [Rouxiella badensis]MCC3742333.1 phosphopantetheine-binding protein [Rouxiella badensis]MCC3747891.1 phosphopantetheine-binding protein [Rouxiella badensis]
MNTPSEFLSFINGYMATDATEEELDVPLVNLENWDSINAVRLMSRLEKELNVRLPVADYLQANTLRQLFDLTRRSAA